VDRNTLSELLNKVASGEVLPFEAMERLKILPYEDLDFAKIDLHRELRTGRPEVVFCLGKTPEQVAKIVEKLSETAGQVLGTKASFEQYQAVATRLLGVEGAVDETCFRDTPNGKIRYDQKSRMIVFRKKDYKPPAPHGRIAVVTGGTADVPIAEEAALTAELYGHDVDRIYDVGVAGIHRLLDKVEQIRKADVVIAIAGMEGALASVLGGLVERPVIAVPTSVGYGASMGGLTALLAMLNSCSLGVSVMNIDNGFGAGHLASMIASP
jgi:NCAIR mutase (PurE)-related protein